MSITLSHPLRTIAFYVVVMLSFSFAAPAFAKEAPKQESFVDIVIPDPPNQSVETDTDIDIRIGKFHYGDPNAYNYVLQQLQTKGDVTKWTPVMRSDTYPMPSFKSDYKGRSALQLSIYLKSDTSRVQHIWLGNYYFHKSYKNYPSLARAFFADTFNDDTLSESFVHLAEQLSFFTYIKTQNPHTCKPVCKVSESDKGRFSFFNKESTIKATFGPEKLKFTSIDGVMRRENSGLGLYASDFTQYDNILKRLGGLSYYKDLDDEAKANVVLSVFAAQMFHRGYKSGTPTKGYLYSLQQPLSMCNLYSYQLVRTLELYDIDTNFVSYVNEFGGAHAVVEVDIAPGLSMLLDAMQGTVYFGDVDDVSNGKFAEEFELARHQDFGINLNSELKSAKNIYFSDNIALSRGQAGHSKDFITIR